MYFNCPELLFLFSKGMMGALAAFSCFVLYNGAVHIRHLWRKIAILICHSHLISCSVLRLCLDWTDEFSLEWLGQYNRALICLSVEEVAVRAGHSPAGNLALYILGTYGEK